MRVGILIIGSLLWDNDDREAWRQSRLRLSEGIRVKAPIYYGRLSRSKTFTMTFGPEGVDGRGILIPCSTVVAAFNNLVAEAEALWGAEDRNASKGDLGKNWGCVGALFRKPNALEFEAAWKNYFPTKCNAVFPVGADGILRIAWPIDALSGKPVDVDIILATATSAESPVPTARAVADAWLIRSAATERYFFENIRCGIRTADDQAIWQCIEQGAPAWLGNNEYSEAVRILREETQRSTFIRTFCPLRLFRAVLHAISGLIRHLHGCD